MEKQIFALTQACEQLKLDYRFIDNEQNVMQIGMPWGYEYFQLGRTPFNSEVVWGLLRDKKHSYDLFSQAVAMPKTLAFLDPRVPEEYRKYSQHSSTSTMVETAISELGLPVIVKPNAGALGAEVHLCQSAEEVQIALERIFNQDSCHYDYVALAQTFIPNQVEYRLICSFKEPVLLYQRGQQSGFNAQYWHRGEKALPIQDETLISRLFQFVKPVYDQLDIGFVGFDIIQSDDNQLYLIELNSSPKFNNFIKDNEATPVINMYCHALSHFIQRRTRF